MSPQHTPRPSRLHARFPNQIRQYRLKAGLSQASVGELVGVGKNTVSAWERGLTCPIAPFLMKLAKTLGTLSEAFYPEFYVTRGPGVGGSQRGR
jgi:transcriptional regulator with XRE-family HTH domain